MLWNYFRLAIRLSRKHKMHSFISIIGLSIGITLSLVMLMYVANEFSYDNFFENGDRIYRVNVEWGSEGSTMKFAGVMPAIAPALNAEVPEVEYAARIRRSEDFELGIGEKNFKEIDIFYADPEILKIFELQLIPAQGEGAFSDPFSIILTKSTAGKYFGDKNPIGEIISINGDAYNVCGVIIDLPVNTHFRFNALISYSTVISTGKYTEQPWNSWGTDLTYMLIGKNTSPEICKNKLWNIFEKNTDGFFAEKVKFEIQPLSDIHWDNSSRADIGPKGNILYAYVFLSAAIFILVIAGFNFMNLSTARYIDRAKEVGVRKVIGAHRTELIKQFLAESFLTSFISITVGIVMYELLSGPLYSYLNIKMNIGIQQWINFILIIVGMLLLIGVVAGSYPAFLLSRFKPADVIKGNTAVSKNKFNFRNVSVTLQFVMTIILICAVLIVFKQVDYMKNSDLGFEKENVAFAYLPMDHPNLSDKYEVIKSELLKNPIINYVSGGYTLPGVNSQYQVSVKKPGTDDKDYITIQTLPVDYDFLNLMKLHLIQGRNFSKDFSSDLRQSIILNETAVKTFNLENPVGQVIMIPKKGEFTEMKVIGVVKDFHLKSLHNVISPAMMIMDPSYYSLIAIKYSTGSHTQTAGYFKKVWESVFPGTELDYRIMSDEYNKYYITEERAGKLILVFTVFALIISCLGLFGLVTYMVSKKVKEIGIRKVLGASVANVVIILTKKFTKLIFISNLIAWPVAYYLISKWLNDFAYKIDISISIFIISGSFALLVALATVGYQALKAALSNPVDSLRYE